MVGKQLSRPGRHFVPFPFGPVSVLGVSLKLASRAIVHLHCGRAESSCGHRASLTRQAAQGGDVLGLGLVVGCGPRVTAAVEAASCRGVIRTGTRHCCVFEFHQQHRAATQTHGEQLHPTGQMYSCRTKNNYRLPQRQL